MWVHRFRGRHPRRSEIQIITENHHEPGLPEDLTRELDDPTPLGALLPFPAVTELGATAAALALAPMAEIPSFTNGLGDRDMNQVEQADAVLAVDMVSTEGSMVEQARSVL